MKLQDRTRAAVIAPEAMAAIESGLVAIVRASVQEQGLPLYAGVQLARVTPSQVAEYLTLSIRAAGLFPSKQQPEVRSVSWSAIYAENGPHDAALYEIYREGWDPFYFSVSQTHIRRVNGKG